LDECTGTTHVEVVAMSASVEELVVLKELMALCASIAFHLACFVGVAFAEFHRLVKLEVLALVRSTVYAPWSWLDDVEAQLIKDLHLGCVMFDFMLKLLVPLLQGLQAVVRALF